MSVPTRYGDCPCACHTPTVLLRVSHAAACCSPQKAEREIGSSQAEEFVEPIVGADSHAALEPELGT